MYVIQIVGAVNNQVEIPGLDCLERAYKYFSSAAKAVELEISEKYSDEEWYKDFKYQLPTMSDDIITRGWFQARYTFGPLVRYSIIIKNITL